MQTNKSPIPHLRPRFFIPPYPVLLACALGVSVTLGPLPAVRAAGDAPTSEQAPAANNSFRLFYDKLANDGEWFQTDDHGFVFQPRVAVDDKTWRPYTDGYWAQTSAGWTWVSNEDFGWACYHYGRWANLVDTGWIWVPGEEWAPAYVSWRVSKDGKRVGWAPLPPEARVSKGEAIENWVDAAYDIGPDAYTFIDTSNFGETSYRTHLIPAEQNETIITETENVTKLDYRTVENRSIFYNGGPDVAVIRTASGGRPIRELHLETRPENVEFFQRGDRRSITEVSGDRIVFATAAPEVITSTSIRINEPAHVNRRLSTVTVDRGYGRLRDPQEAERFRVRLRSQGPPPPPQIEQRAAAAIRRNSAAGFGERRAPGAPGANAPLDRNGRPNRNEAPVPGVNPRGEANRAPAAPENAAPVPTPAGAERRNGRGQEPAATPAATPDRNGERSPASSPAATPEAGRPRDQRPARQPEATPEPSATPHRSAPPASPAQTHAPAEASPTPSAPGNRPESTPSAREREKPAAERPTPAGATPRANAENADEKRAKPEAAPRADAPQAERRQEGENAARHAEPPAKRETDEKRTAPANPDASAAKRPAGQERETTAENAGKVRADKKEASSEKPSTSPKP